jgi:hypothetical protein|tara:strand:- start:43 stop:504 length:462 start_codon:yes stop_codon:yes gene_type:complete
VAKELANAIPRSETAWKKLGYEIVKKIKNWTIKQGKDVYGRPFKAYSKQYATHKAAGKFPRQSMVHAKGKPNFVLTGDTMGDLKVLDATRDSVTIGWAAWGHIIEGQAKRGRAVSTDDQPVAKHIIDFVAKNYLKQLDTNLRKTSSIVKYSIG